MNPCGFLCKTLARYNKKKRLSKFSKTSTADSYSAPSVCRIIYHQCQANHLTFFFQMKSFKSFRTATIELFSLFVSLCLSFVVCSTYNEDLAALQERLKGKETFSWSRVNKHTVL